MSARKAAHPHGEIRQSQILTTYGPGSIVNLPNHSVIIGGLDFWGDPDRDGLRPVHEERLLRKLRDALEIPGLRLFAPPVDTGDQSTPRGVTAFQFPQWFVAQYEEQRDPFRCRPLVHSQGLVKGKYLGPDRKKYPVVPVRFVQACINGHISDIDWYAYLHGENNPCRRPLWLDERGTSGDFTDVFVRCECGKTKSLALAMQANRENPPLGFCKGHRPWLGPNAQEPCGGEGGKPEPNRLLVPTATNAYFSQTTSAISIPDTNEALRKAVDSIWEDFLQYVEEPDELKKERRKAKVKAALEEFSDEQVWDEIDRRRRGIPEDTKSLKQAEVQTLLASRTQREEDIPEGNYFARALPPFSTQNEITRHIERVVLVHRLREVAVQLGFTRFEPAIYDDEELSLDVRRASLAREVSWLPAVENHGEGVFVAFRQDSLAAWLEREPVKARLAQLREGFEAWQNAHPSRQKAKLPGPRYLFLHSLSHLLITAVSLECGYSASSIRERIYVSEEGCGILLYTGGPDAEGTLGGLVQVGHRIETHLRNALELGRLCSNDPVCAQHRPNNPHEERFLHGAACHGCLLTAETSCESRNEFLDRALVVPTVDGLEAEFFGEEET